MQPTTKTHCLKFKTPTPTLWLTATEYINIVRTKQADKEGFWYEEVYYVFNTIGEWCTPEILAKKRPQYQPIKENKIKRSKKERGKIVIQKIIKGLEGYINSSRYQGTEAPKIMLKEWQLKLQKNG